MAVGHNKQIYPSFKCLFHIPLVSGFIVTILRNSFSRHDLSNSQTTCNTVQSQFLPRAAETTFLSTQVFMHQTFPSNVTVGLTCF